MPESPRGALFGASLQGVIFAFALLLAAYLSNFRSYIHWPLHPYTPRVSESAWIEAIGWLCCTTVMLGLALRRGELGRVLAACREQPWLAAFIATATASVLWTPEPAATGFRLLALLCSTAVAAYVAVRSSHEELLDYLCWLGAAAVLASGYLALVDPILGTDTNPPYDGAWRGIFWHKNHLGSLAAFFNAVFLVRLWRRHAVPGRGLSAAVAALYLLSLGLVVLARSAAGYFLVAILHGVVAMCALWLRHAERLQSRHYRMLFVVAVLFLVAAITQVDAILGLANRDAGLTGRTQLWAYLLGDAASQHPWLGRGFGAVWEDAATRSLGRSVLGWRYPVMIGDNGFLDILLNVGLAGLGLFLMFYLSAWRSAIGALRRRRDPAAVVLPVIMAYSLCANLTYSLMAEIEVLFWGLLVVVAFSGGGAPAVPRAPGRQ